MSDEDVPMCEETGECAVDPTSPTPAVELSSQVPLPSASGWNDLPFVPIDPVDRSQSRRTLHRRHDFPLGAPIRELRKPVPVRSMPILETTTGAPLVRGPAVFAFKGDTIADHKSQTPCQSGFYVPPPRASQQERDLCSPDDRLTLIIETINDILSGVTDADNVRQYMQEITLNWNARSCNNEMQQYMIRFARELRNGCLEDAIFIVQLLAREPDAAWFTMFSRAVIDVIKENPSAAIHKKNKRSQ